MPEELTAKEVAQGVLDKAGIDITLLPNVVAFVDPRDQVWKVGKPTPVKPELMVFGIFIDGEDVRAYCAPLHGKDADGEDVGFTRYTLSRQSGSLVVETMPLAVFQEEMAAELLDASEAAAKIEPEEEDVDGAPTEIEKLGFALGSQEALVDAALRPPPSPVTPAAKKEARP